MKLKIAVALAALLLPSVALADLTGTSSSTPTAQSSWSVSGQHVLLGFTVVPAVAGYAMIWDATTPPPDGVVSPGACFPISPPVAGGPNPSVSMANTPAGVVLTNGITIAFSTTGCFVKTSANAFISINYVP